MTWLRLGMLLLGLGLLAWVLQAADLAQVGGALAELGLAGAAATFFIPASLGATELAFVLIVEALTGQAALGLAVGLVRRAREILWLAWGLALGWSFSALPAAPSLRPAVSPATAEVSAAKQDR